MLMIFQYNLRIEMARMGIIIHIFDRTVVDKFIWITRAPILR